MIPGMPGDSLVYLNGEFTRADQAKISVLDRGFIFGDGIYEVVPAYRGKAFRMAEHLNRLERSLAAIRIPMPMDRAALTAVIERLIAGATTQDCIVYLQITRGVYKRDHAFSGPGHHADSLRHGHAHGPSLGPAARTGRGGRVHQG